MEKARFITHNGTIVTLNIPNGLSVGQVVKITDLGCCYTTYRDAFIFFGVDRYAKLIDDYDTQYLEMNPKDNARENNWVIVNFALHSQSRRSIVALIKNCHNDYLVIGPRGLEALDKKPTKFFIEEPFIQIPKKYI